MACVTVEAKVACWNVAAAGRDDANGNSLSTRSEGVLEHLGNHKEEMDVLCVLEAGRGGSAWLEMALNIEKATGLTYSGLWRPNGSGNPLCKALFIRTSKFWLDSAHQRCDMYGDEKAHGSILFAHIRPVVEERVDMGSSLRLAFFHFPMGLKERLGVADWIAGNADLAEVWMGDANTFPDFGGPEILERVGMPDRIPPECPYTFSAFPYDSLKVSQEAYLKYHQQSTVVETHPDGSVTVLPRSVLDRVFSRLPVEVGVHPSPSSDHCLILAHIKS